MARQCVQINPLIWSTFGQTCSGGGVCVGGEEGGGGVVGGGVVGWWGGEGGTGAQIRNTSPFLSFCGWRLTSLLFLVVLRSP